MYNDNCKTDAACCAVQAPADSMKNTICEIHDHAMKAREIANDICRKLFGATPIYGDDMKVECAFDALLDIKKIEQDTLEVLYSVIGRLGD